MVRGKKGEAGREGGREVREKLDGEAAAMRGQLLCVSPSDGRLNASTGFSVAVCYRHTVQSASCLPFEGHLCEEQHTLKTATHSQSSTHTHTKRRGA